MVLKLVQRSPDPAILAMAETVARGRKVDDPIAMEVALAASEVSIGPNVHDVSEEYELPVTIADAKARWDKAQNRMIVPSEKERFLRGVAARLNHVRKFLSETDGTLGVIRTEAYWNPAEKTGKAYFRFIREKKYAKVDATE